MKYSFSLLSKYRQVLMGIAILEVMIGHYIGWVDISYLKQNALVAFLVARLFDLVHTPGFMLLSGLGLYYSFARDNNIKRFYSRRIKRMWLPYIFMAVPLVGIICMQHPGHYSFDQYLGWVTAVGYWFPGKAQYCNMWYISMSLVCYAVFPLLFAILFDKDGNRRMSIRWTLPSLLLLSILCTWGISHYFPEYYDLVYLALPKGTVFILGVYFGYLSMHHETYDLFKYLMFAFLLFVVFFAISRYDMVFFNFADFCVIVITTSLLCMLIDYFAEMRFVKFLVSLWTWFGKYTLELYVLHLMFYSIFLSLECLTVTLASTFAIVLSVALCAPVHKLTSKL